MIFTTDRQTLDDLTIFGKNGEKSVYQLFNHTRTHGASVVLDRLFREPLSNGETISKRVSLFSYFASNAVEFPFEREWFDHIEQYLAMTDERTRLSTENTQLAKRLVAAVSADTEMIIVQKGIVAAVALVNATNVFMEQFSGKQVPYTEEAESIHRLLKEDGVAPLLSQLPDKKISSEAAILFDGILRFRYRSSIKKLLEHLYFLDVYQSIGNVARLNGMSFPHAKAEGNGLSMLITDMYHPLLTKPVANSVSITDQGNVLFLTGANMAGKSTFMKSLGITVYLAHLGFPVPAKEMVFSPLDGIFTTINLSDNLAIGASHFYAEVLRVKKVAEELGSGRKLLVIFDELFRGTNVKDAYEGTIAIASAFATRRSSIFVISTHIIEAGEELKRKFSNISFRYMPTRMNGEKPEYTYKMEEGITNDRHGMVIIRNEGIMGLLETENAKPAITGKFILDHQTTEDLNLLGKFRRGSIYGLFCQVQTLAGEQLLEEMFRSPLTDETLINHRSELFRQFGDLKLGFPIDGRTFDEMENYLDGHGPAGRLSSLAGTIRLNTMKVLARDEGFSTILTGIKAAVAGLQKVKEFLDTLLQRFPTDNPYFNVLRSHTQMLLHPQLMVILSAKVPENLSLASVARYNYLLRTECRTQLSQVRRLMVELDVFIAVGNLAQEKGWQYAVALPSSENLMEVQGLRHPAITNAVGNDLTFNKDANLLFLTGANMAGKSTLMKSMGVAVYLAHLGFPVAAECMKFSIREGLFTSINVSDDISQGYSHFYAEVQRVKQAAEEVSNGKNLVVIFDELFKGTNVKDAFDATFAVTAAFSKRRNCLFVISTHIVEVGHALEKSTNVDLSYLPTIMQDDFPRYTYQLEKGISNDRHGMTIIRKEGVLEKISNNVQN